MIQMTLAADATPAAGGQGLNLTQMVEALHPGFDLRVFSRGKSPFGESVAVPPSRLGAFVGRIPVLRRARDWRVEHESSEFDRFVAAEVARACGSVFQGVTGHCHDSLAAARKAGAKTVVDSVTEHIDEFCEAQRTECARFGLRPTIGGGLHRRMLEEYRRADLIRVMSEPSRRTFLERGFREDAVVKAQPGFDIAQFSPARFTDPLFRVGFVGLIEPWKGFHYLIEGFESWGFADSELVLFGGPGSRPVSNYLAQARERCPRIRISSAQVRGPGGPAGVYGQCSVLVHPSLSDGFGYVVGEAMACGLPVIVTDVTGASELVADGVNGYVVPARDSAAIRDRLAHLAAHPALVREMGAAARKTIENLGDNGLRTYARFLSGWAA